MREQRFGCVILSDGDYSAARGEAAAESALNTSHTWPVSCRMYGCRESLGHSVAHAGPTFPLPWLCLLLWDGDQPLACLVS